MTAVNIYSDFGAQENKVCHCFHCFSIYLPWNDGTGFHDLHWIFDEWFDLYWMLSLKPAFSLSSFTFIKRLFNSSSLSALRVVSSAYQRLLLFFPEILIPVCASSSHAFRRMSLVSCGSDSKASVNNVRDLSSIPGLGRFPGERNGNPLQYSCLENPMDGGAWCSLLSMGSQRVRHDWATSLSLCI